MRRVFHIITTISRGGAENQLLVLVREQIELGLEVHVIYLKGDPELEIEFKQMGAMVHHDLAHMHPALQPIALRRIIGKSEPIVHAHLPRAELVSLFCPARLTLISSRHNAEPFFPGAPKFASNFLSRLVELRSLRIIAISEAVRNFILNQGEILNAQKIEVVLYGYRPTNDPKNRDLRSSSGLLKFGTISRLTEQKDIPTMLRAFQIIHDDFPKASLSIVGSGTLQEYLLGLCNELGLESSVHFLGRTSKIIEFLTEIDAFILTSTYEGFGMVLLEAIDAGIPIVASRNSAIPEVLGVDFPGLCETGNFIDFSSKILKLKDPDYRHRVLQLQEQRLVLFDAEGMAQEINRIYSI